MDPVGQRGDDERRGGGLADLAAHGLVGQAQHVEAGLLHRPDLLEGQDEYVGELPLSLAGDQVGDGGLDP